MSAFPSSVAEKRILLIGRSVPEIPDLVGRHRVLDHWPVSCAGHDCSGAGRRDHRYRSARTFLTEAEDHDTASEDAFRHAIAPGDFALW